MLTRRAYLKIEDISVRYYKKDILSEVSLEVMPGEIVAIIGANGAGKSTLLKAISGVVPPHKGKIIVEGRNVTGMETTLLFNLGISSLLQGNNTFPSLTVLEHLLLINKTKSKIDNKNDSDSMNEVWSIFPELYEVRNKRAGLLSGGERQKLSIATMLVQDAKMWLLDEPSGGLAPQAVKNVMNIIRRLSTERGIAVLLAEQNLREALKIADHAYVLKGGKVFHEENPSEILNNGKMEEIFFK
ncbi:MAG TPA: ABC transporter ATP-binding protein [Nitrospirota bacterium]|nr:ABC transporter ATP-binding protein [Nitrospirota bacterium]